MEILLFPELNGLIIKLEREGKGSGRQLHYLGSELNQLIIGHRLEICLVKIVSL